MMFAISRMFVTFAQAPLLLYCMVVILASTL